MRILKLLMISIVVLALILVAFSSLLPAQVRISRAIDISAEPEDIKPKINDITQWVEWNEYIKALPDKSFSGDSVRANQLIVKISRGGDSVIHTLWRRPGGKEFTGVFNIFHSRSITTVQWYFDFTFRWYPWEKFSSIIYDKQLGPQMEQSLINLRELTEKSP